MPRASSARQSPFQIGILLLLYQLLAQIGVYTLQPVTLGLIALQTGLFLGLIDLGWGRPAALCLQARAVLDRAEFQRVFLAPLLHGNDLHLYYNMVSFAYKGRTLERRSGSIQFAFTLAVLTALCGFFYVGLAFIAAEELRDPSYLDQCAVGFSSVIFALKVLVNSDSAASMLDLSVWSELLIIQLLVPNASFIGHLAGILAGIAYVWGAALFRAAFKPLFLALEYPATTGIAALIVCSHFGWIRKPWKTKHFWSASSTLVCLSAGNVLESQELIRFLSSPVEHSGDVHLAMSLVSLAIKGVQLEQRGGGSIRHVVRVATAAIGTGVMYILASRAALEFPENPYVSGSECVMGLSGTLFALKVFCLFQTESLWHPASLFEVFELFMLAEEKTRLFHVSGFLCGTLMLLWERSRRFPGSGTRLVDGGGGARRSPWTRSWGYANFPTEATVVVRPRREDEVTGSPLSARFTSPDSTDEDDDLEETNARDDEEASCTEEEADSEHGIDLENDNDDEDETGEGFYVGGESPTTPSSSADGTQTLTLDEVRRRRLERFSK